MPFNKISCTYFSAVNSEKSLVKGKTNNYSFLEKIVHKDKVQDFLAGKE